MSRRKTKAKIVPEGVNIYGIDGEWLAGITERDAVELYESLKRQMPRIRKLARIMK